jgi:streptogramin lyase
MKKNSPLYAIVLITMIFLPMACKKSGNPSGGTVQDSLSGKGNVVSTYAGLGIALGGGSAPRLEFYQPTSVCTGQDGSIFVADYGHALIKKVSATGSVNVFAGNGSGQFCLDGVGTGAGFSDPEGVFMDQNGSMIVADSHCGIRRINAAGGVTTYFQNDLSNPYQVFPSFACLDSYGNIFMISLDNGADPSVYKIDLQAKITRYIGSGLPGHSDGSGISASFIYLQGICIDNSDNLYVVDGSRVREITDGSVTTIAGSDSSGYADGQGTAAAFGGLGGICVDANNNIYVTDGNRIRKIDPTRNVTTIAGSDESGYTDGDASVALFYNPKGICADANGNLYVADFGNNVIRKIKLK